MSDEIVIENVDSEPVSETDLAYRGDNPTVTSGVGEDEGAWQLTEQEAAVAVVEAATIEAAAEIGQLEQETEQTDILSQLLTLIQVGFQELRDSQALAMEAQTAAIVRLSTPSDSPTSLETTPKTRLSPAQRAERRQKRSAERRANRGK